MSVQQVVIKLLQDLKDLKQKRRAMNKGERDPVEWGNVRRAIHAVRVQLTLELARAGFSIRGQS